MYKRVELPFTIKNTAMAVKKYDKKNCRNCGKEFTFYAMEVWRKFCTRPCYLKYCADKKLDSKIIK